MRKLSILIPTYEMGGYGHIYLSQLFDNLLEQTFQDFLCVVVDQSQDDLTEKVVNQYIKDSPLYIQYLRNDSGINCSARNINIGLRHIVTPYVKFVFEDDYCYQKDSLEKIFNALEAGNNWVISDYIHANHDLTEIKDFQRCGYAGHPFKGNHTGNPSLTAFRFHEHLQFDETLRYIVDCDFNWQLFKLYGMPHCIHEPLMCFRIHPVSACFNPLYYQRKDIEQQYFWYKDALLEHNKEF